LFASDRLFQAVMASKLTRSSSGEYRWSDTDPVPNNPSLITDSGSGSLTSGELSAELSGSLSEISDGHRLSRGSRQKLTGTGRQKLQNKPFRRVLVINPDTLDQHVALESTSSDNSPSEKAGSASLPRAADIPAIDSAPASGGIAHDNIPIARKEGQPTKGGIFHDSGTCKPCLFVRTDVGCSSGADCEFCHMQHRRRCCKGKRDRYKKRVARIQDEAASAAGEPREGHGGYDMAPENTRTPGHQAPQPRQPPPNFLQLEAPPQAPRNIVFL